MIAFEFNGAGKKGVVNAEIAREVQDKNVVAHLQSLVNSCPGDCCSFTAILTGTEDGTHGTLSISGSFWKEKA